MPVTTFSEFILGDMLARYVSPHDEPGMLGLQLWPRERKSAGATPREQLDADAVRALPQRWLPLRAWEVDPLVHLTLAGQPGIGGFAHGRTSRAAEGAASLRLQRQERIIEDDNIIIRTLLRSATGLDVQHDLIQQHGERALRVRTAVRNAGASPVIIESLSSFSLGGLSPFSDNDSPENLHVHRFRTTWSAEGRACDESIEDLHLERSWTGHSVQCERFGVVGSMPVNGWHPWLGIEDRGQKVWWAATLAHPGSWQMEISRRADQLAISGGQAGYELGHWRKTLAPGETFGGPEAFLTVTTEGIESAAERLLDPSRHGPATPPATPTHLPVIFNEWCTSWGSPTHPNLIALADRLRGSGVTYLVIDDGWAQRSPGALFQENGDWIVCPKAFPQGLRETAEAIRVRGLIPGLWFEFEVVNAGTKAWNEVTHQLHRDGRPLQVGTRRFWDFRDPWVHAYLEKKVVHLLRDCGIGYLKVDYNDTIGLGCDGAESLGEGLRQHLAGVQRFFRTLRETLPDLVIENCSSGGHRLEPSMLALSDVTSVTDAHETPDIPIIAANVLRFAPAEQNLIWAVLHETDSMQRLSYSLAATFLGRMCLSGQIARLKPVQWTFTQRAITLYRKLAATMIGATYRRFGDIGDSYQHPTGAQAVRAVSVDEQLILIIWHAFASPPAELQVPLPTGNNWILVEEFCDRPDPTHIRSNVLMIPGLRAWSGGIAVVQTRHQ